MEKQGTEQRCGTAPAPFREVVGGLYEEELSVGVPHARGDGEPPRQLQEEEDDEPLVLDAVAVGGAAAQVRRLCSVCGFACGRRFFDARAEGKNK